MSKLTLLIDGNWLLNAKKYMFKDEFLLTEPEENRRRAQARLMDAMLQSINFIVNQFNQIDNMILVSDGGSWRKSIERPEHLKDKDYKGTRVRSEDEDWNMIFETLNILRDKFTFNNVTSVHASGLEGDDWISSLSRRLGESGTSTLIWSTDNDLSQLVANREDSICAWYNGNELKLHDSLEATGSYDDFMSLDVSDKSDIVEGLTKLVQKVTYINPNDVILSKIICGDKSDNIIPVAQYTQNGKTYSITDTKFQPIKEELGLKTSADLLDMSEDIAKAIHAIKIAKVNKFEETPAYAIIESIEYNARLVELRDDYLPVELKAVVDAAEIIEYDLSNFRNNYKVIIGADDEIMSLAADVISDINEDDLLESLPF